MLNERGRRDAGTKAADMSDISYYRGVERLSFSYIMSAFCCADPSSMVTSRTASCVTKAE